MDLKKFVPETDTLEVALKYKGEVLENDDGTPMTIEVYLPHSKKYREVRHGQADKMIEEKRERLKSAEAEEMGLDFLSKTTKSWNITFDGKKPKFTPAKAKEIYEFLPWVAELLLSEVEKSRAFT